jgi:hypothetical protein
VEKFTEQEEKLLQIIGYLVLLDDKLSQKVLAEAREEYKADDASADSLLEKLEEIIG